MLTSCPYLSCKWPCRDTRGDMRNPERREQSQQIPQEPAILCQPCGSTTDTTIIPREQRQKVISGSASPSLCPPCSSAPTSKAPGRHKPPLCPTHPQVPRLPDVAAVPLAVLEDLGTEKGGMWHSGTGTGEHLPVCPDAGEEKGSGPLHHSSSGRSSSLSMAPKGQGFARGSFKDAR